MSEESFSAEEIEQCAWRLETGLGRDGDGYLHLPDQDRRAIELTRLIRNDSVAFAEWLRTREGS